MTLYDRPCQKSWLSSNADCIPLIVILLKPGLPFRAIMVLIVPLLIASLSFEMDRIPDEASLAVTLLTGFLL
jgi:hypothetical protein